MKYKRTYFWAVGAFFLLSLCFLKEEDFFVDTRFVFRERPFLHLPAQAISSSAKYILTPVTTYSSGHARDTVILVLIIAYFIPEVRLPLFLFAFILENIIH